MEAGLSQGDAILEAGLTPGRDHKGFQLAPAPSHPDPSPPKTILRYPLTSMTRSRLRGAYRSMIGLDQNDETWDTQSAAPPTKTTQFMESMKKPKLTDTCYNIDSTYFTDKGLNIDSTFTTKSTTFATIKHSRLGDRDRALASVLSMVNMLDILMSSGNQVVNKILNTLKEFDGQEEGLEEVGNFIDKADRIKED